MTATGLPAEVQQDVLNSVYRDFQADAEWPLARELDVAFAGIVDPYGGLQAVIRRIGSRSIICDAPASDMGRVKLHLRGLARVAAAKEDLEDYLDAVRFASDRYVSSKSHSRDVSFDELSAFYDLTPLRRKRLYEHLVLDSRFTLSCGSDRFTAGPAVVRLTQLETIHDYLAKIEAYLDNEMHSPPDADSQYRAPIRRVFLSHAAADRPLAEYLARVIHTSVGNIQVFVASIPGEIPTGAEWLDTIRRELRGSDTYIVLLTPTSVTRSWIWFETGAAWMSDRRLLPVTAAGLAKADVPLPLGAHQTLSLEDARDAEQFFKDIHVAIASVPHFMNSLRELRVGEGTLRA